MLKKTIEYHDLDGNLVRDTYYFHYNQAELAKIKLMYGDEDGDVAKHFTALLQSGDRKAIIAAFDELILGSYGQRSVDGKRFEKKDGQLAQEFKETEAYSALFMELISNGGREFQEFLRGVLPAGLQDKLDADTELQNRVALATERIQTGSIVDVKLPDELPKPKDELPDFVRENRFPTKAELLAMTPDQIHKAFEARKK